MQGRFARSITIKTDGGWNVIQLYGSTELEAILDGVFKPVRREERRQHRRRVLRGTMHLPLLTLNYPGADGFAAQADQPQADQPQADWENSIPVPVQVATSEDLVRNGYGEGRVINPTPPHRPGIADDSAGDLHGLAQAMPTGRVWSEGT